MNHAKDYKTYLPKLIEMTNKGELKPHIELFPSHGSKGLETIFDAVDVSFDHEFPINFGFECLTNLSA